MSKKKNTITEYRSYYLAPDLPIFLLTGEHWRISDTPSGRLHFHNCLEIGICHSESGFMEFYNDPVPFQADDIVLIPRNIPHTTYSTKGCESLWSYIYVDLAEMLWDILPPYWKNQKNSQNIYINQATLLHGSDHPYIHSLILRIIDELKEQKTNYRHSVRGLILVLYIELLRVQTAAAQGSGGVCAFFEENDKSNSLVIAPALNYIEANYMLQFPIEHLAELCHWSPTHFRRTFSEIMGVSPLSYLNNIRITKACDFLRSTEQSILEISESVGFQSVSSFNRCFAAVMETTPRDYRREMYDKMKKKYSIEEFTGWLMPEKL